ncbi:putative bifunctional diguanylate cyclase/phosphodiesterase [Aeromonas sp. FDAARGOS 1407]|uniref:putative bifunctional diguanylate cyclase/phosphodiesterase n=1 Tax=Aeromonas TaxID=642 RepID=UPI001C21DE73|nr:EAL domain-containing protein [Aeromonas sp. FDAARGOS 1407]QXC32393.1 EAL domain-containing protein [Aeromonas sp. FDAARGOS 1407]
MNNVSWKVISLSISSLVICNLIYQNVFHILSTDGHHHSEYSIIWAPNAYMVFFLWAFYSIVPKIVTFLTAFMTVIGFNLVFFSFENYPVGMGSYYVSLLMYALNNGMFIFGFYFLLKLFDMTSIYTKYGAVISYILLHIGGALCTSIASLSALVFPSSSLSLIYQFFAANMMAFTFFTSYLFLSDMFIPNDKRIKMMNFSLLVFLSSGVFYIVNVYFHDLSKENFALVMMASFICLFIQSHIYFKIVIVSMVSALFAAVNVALDLSFYEFILFYSICISTSIILIMRRQEADYVDSLKVSVLKLEQSRLIDPLTMVLNREGFIRALKRKIDSNVECLVAYADLDKFKEINDMMGHTCGDLVLQIVASRIKSVLSDMPDVARLGGDEFAFIITGDKLSTIEKCQTVMDKVRKPMRISDKEFSIGMSIGFCLHPNQEKKIDLLLDKADVAMFFAKRSHAKHPVCYEKTMDHRKSQEVYNLHRSFSIEQILADCYPVYQPIFDIHSHEVVSFESLLRYPSLSTMDIINWAEEYGYMNEIFEFMVKNAAQVVIEIGLPIAVNISPSQLIFNGEYIEHLLSDIIESVGVPPYYLNVEITESVPILDQESFLLVINRIKSLGVRVYLDDFGTGYAFFSTLSTGVFDAIKIDKNIVNKVTDYPSMRRLLSSIINYASGTNMFLVAEGCETKDELEILQSIGVRLVQGFYFSKPLLKESIISMYSKTNKLAYES